MISYNKFIEVGKLYKARQVTLEQRQRLSVLADKMETYVLTSLKFITYTSHFHGITQHMPGLDTLTWRRFQCSRWCLAPLCTSPQGSDDGLPFFWTFNISGLKHFGIVIQVFDKYFQPDNGFRQSDAIISGYVRMSNI